MSFKFGYRQLRRLQGGRFSDVYEVEDQQAENGKGAKYAMKVIEPDMEIAPHNVRNEVAIMEKMKKHAGIDSYSGNVVRLLREFTNPLEIGMLFPLYECGLEDIIREKMYRRTKFMADGQIEVVYENRMQPAEIRQITKGILSGLKFIHECGIIHRDLNPNNVLFRNKSDLDPVIIDFGISYDKPNNNGLESPDDKITDIGTGYYKAPELLMSVRNYGEGVDIWSAAIILCRMCSKNGEMIFDEDASRSDLALLSSIVTAFGSPPRDWEDCKDSRTFHAMSQAFFTKAPLPDSKVLYQLWNSEGNEDLIRLFRRMTRYASKERPSAEEALEMIS
ncbi:hypothetical protein BRETT_004609 [Brettanomyces bruxellensis]|uniref:Protein kinase domain-containing protein n=1 Tax=Dekkera bruxellensis TaxID=5007 RepID=A0A871RA58_DEKBR|nr:uncharacterized protein BRETT_004609 [Brettanomyces bruxellensis]QOU19962.1 hypothetical protein BRETT_004609 [Brettanomyces bruxellensis]